VYCNDQQSGFNRNGRFGRNNANYGQRICRGYAGLGWLLPLGGFGRWRGVDRFWLEPLLARWLLLLVNGLTAFNLTRVFRLVFWLPQVKTCRPRGRLAGTTMMGLIVITISVPFMLRQLTLLPPILSLNPTAETLIVASGFPGSSWLCS